MVAVQRVRLLASTAHCNQAPLALKLPDGTWSMPAPSLRSRMASSTTACWRWNASRVTALPARSVRNAKCRQSGLAAVGQSGAAHDQTPPVVGALCDLGQAVRRVVNVNPRVFA